MTASILYLFPDTNIFIECRPLEELDWSRWAEFDEVHLIVCRTVLREIDNQKIYYRRPRVSKRARDTYKTFSQFDRPGGPEQLTIRECQPAVRLRLAPLVRPSPNVADVLDYSKPDDEIIGYLLTYVEQHPGADTRLLTHDFGPKMTARSLGVRAEGIDDDWLLPPEPSDVERENARLKEQLRALQKTEPQFEIKCLDQNGAEAKRLDLQWEHYPPLSSDEISDFIATLKSRRPMATNFGRRERATREVKGLAGLIGSQQTYRPVYDAEAEKYRQEYADWLDRCEEILSQLHESLQANVQQPACRFRIQNVGSSLGESALVEVVAHGEVLVRPPQWQPAWAAEELERKRRQALRLPPPPKAPKGVWHPSIESMADLLYPHAQVMRDALSRGLSLDAPSPWEIRSPIHPLPPEHDAETFYYRGGRAKVPTSSVELECDRWRHGRDAEDFQVEVHVEHETGQASGLIECVVHCKNLSTPVRERVPVTVTVVAGPTKEQALSLINDLRRAASE